MEAQEIPCPGQMFDLKDRNDLPVGGRRPPCRHPDKKTHARFNGQPRPRSTTQSENFYKCKYKRRFETRTGNNLCRQTHCCLQWVKLPSPLNKLLCNHKANPRETNMRLKSQCYHCKHNN
jgi:hypothetical protein